MATNRSPLRLAPGILLALLCLPASGFAGGEEEKAPARKSEERTPEDQAAPGEPEAPELSVGAYEEPLAPQTDPAVAQPAPPRRPLKDRDPDENVDYARLLDTVEVADPLHGVLPPALGFRGYRPSYMAVGVGDRTPGIGGLIEYSWNRVAMGLFASYLSTRGSDRKNVERYGFAGIYGLYRWLPFDISPFFSLGLEAGSQTDEPVGGLTGLGIEARIWQGWTTSFGWTFHSTAHRGFLGGSFGWSF